MIYERAVCMHSLNSVAIDLIKTTAIEKKINRVQFCTELITISVLIRILKLFLLLYESNLIKY